MPEKPTETKPGDEKPGDEKLKDKEKLDAARIEQVQKWQKDRLKTAEKGKFDADMAAAKAKGKPDREVIDVILKVHGMTRAQL